MEDLAAPAIAKVKDGTIKFHPERFAKVYLDWLENIRPWCISRQLWWGHQLPVYYRDGETYVGTTAPEGDGWERDPDVLDTWFSSGLWPFATLGWPEQTPELAAFFPTDAVITARDIIFLWVARMVFFSLEFTGEIPFEHVIITPTIQAPDGQRMSKTKGTGIDPLEIISGGERAAVFPQGGSFPAYGADAMRWGLLAMSSTQDVRFSEEKIAQGAALSNKLFNASRLILLALGDDATVPETAPAPVAIEDKWILSRLQVAKQDFARRLEGFDFSHAALGLYDFVFGELCDWYLELIKARLYDDALRPDVAPIALHVLSETLAMAHPVIPFVTEELWSHLPGASGLLATARFPDVDEQLIDAAAEAELGRAIEAITALRGWRESVGAKKSLTLSAALEADGYERTAAAIARIVNLSLVDANGTAAAASVAIPGGAVAVLPTDEIDFAADERRKAERRKTLAAEIKRAEGKLSNERFVARAPQDVVQAERDKLAALQAELAEL